jgi:hypothetical protein
MCNRKTVLLACGAFMWAAGLGILARPSSAQTVSMNRGSKAIVTIRGLNNFRNGLGGGGSTIQLDLVPGTSGRRFATAGRVVPRTEVRGGISFRDDELCGVSVSAARPPEGDGSRYVWQFDVTMLAVETDKVTFDLAFERSSRAAPGDTVRDTLHLILREDEPRTIDLVHASSSSACDSVFVEVSARMAEEPTNVSKMIDWELWLNNGSEAGTAHRQLTTRQGRAVPFEFDPIKTVSVELTGKREDVLAQLYGQVRARVRVDGSIDVALSTERSASRDLSGSRVSTFPRDLGPAAGSGQKNFVLKPGEAVRIVLPPVGGYPGYVPPTGSEMSITMQARVR